MDSNWPANVLVYLGEVTMVTMHVRTTYPIPTDVCVVCGQQWHMSHQFVLFEIDVLLVD